MTEFTSMKGFRDFLPDEMAARRDVIDRMEDAVRRFGFREIDTPSLETTELFRVKSGDELMEQMYSFTDKGGREVALIPEQTPTRARLVAFNKTLSKPIKWFSTSKRWRYENPQKGRLREFYQTDIDIFGVDSVAADAEILDVTAEIMEALDVLDAVTILINDRRLLEGILSAHGVSEPRPVMEVIDDREKMTREEFVDELHELGMKREKAFNVDDLVAVSGPITEAFEEVEELAPDAEESQQALDRMRELIGELEARDVADTVEIDLSIVRGLAYYTGLVFEVFDTEGDLRAVCGGGRYDGLVELFGGQSTPAVGLAVGDAPVEELMRREGVWPAEELETDVYVLPVSDAERSVAQELAVELRAEGLVVETDLTGSSVGQQLGYAEKIGSDQVVIAGSRDLEQDAVTLKDMDSGDEELVGLDAVVDEVLDRVG